MPIERGTCVYVTGIKVESDRTLANRKFCGYECYWASMRGPRKCRRCGSDGPTARMVCRQCYDTLRKMGWNETLADLLTLLRKLKKEAANVG